MSVAGLIIGTQRSAVEDQETSRVVVSNGPVASFRKDMRLYSTFVK